jgi:ParB family chromosome partitioning protein
VPVSKQKIQKHGLGRGFASLIPTDLLDESFDPTADQDQQVSELRQIKLDQIHADPDQPRKVFEQDALDELASSIKQHGILQPIIVTPHGSGYKIVAGERRYRASKLAGLDKIPALVRTLTDQHKLELSLIENLQRADLNVMEIATAYLKLRDQFNMTLEEIRQSAGVKSISAVSNRLRLLKLPSVVIERLIEGSITEGQARPLIILDEDTVEKVLGKIIKEDWSARRIEQFVNNYKKNLDNKKLTKTKRITSNPYEPQLKKLQSKLGSGVDISVNNKGAGFIKIKFKDQEDFERLQKIIG